ncbi:MAG: CotH kinase family protein [Bacteroidaceae bacterium]|nr:CotH kinase family protein [Bacteroidaceae bacterium]
MRLLLSALLSMCVLTSGAQTIAELYHQLLAESQDLYRQAIGKESQDIPINASQLSSNASDWQEGQHIEYLVDNNANTFWHSDWHNQVNDTHYIQIDFPQPIGGNIGLHVLRRLTSDNHVTLMGVLGSNDQTHWDSLGTITLGNASSGLEYISDPVSLGDTTYQSLRFTILANTSGNTFGHFAEFIPAFVNIFGPNCLIDLGPIAAALRQQIAIGQSLTVNDITPDALQQLRQAYNAFNDELDNLRRGNIPSYLKQHTDLPSLYINTYDGTDITSKEIYQYAKMWRVRDGLVEIFDSLQIRGRGNSTWGLPKKPYRIKFKHATKFLGNQHANARNWTLMANCSDKTLIRNAVASYIAKLLGQPFVPAATFVDVTLNSTFLGNYQVSDQIDIHPRRIDIVEQDSIPTDTSDITGGYYMEIGTPASGHSPWFSTDRGVPISVRSPDNEIIQPQQVDYIRQYMNNIEERIFSTDFRDPIRGYRAFVDSLTLASWFLTVEYSGNCDGLYSIYCYKQQADSHLYMGPIWDYDIAFNNCHRIGEVTNRLMLDAGYGGNNGKNWFVQMYDDPWFRTLIGRRWHKAVCEENLVERTLAFVDSLATELDESQQLNYQTWPIDQRTWDELQLFSTYQEGIDYLKAFLVNHAAYLSSVFPNPDGLQPPLPPPSNPMNIDPDYYYYIYNVGNDHPIDICDDAALIGTWSRDDDRALSQQWEVRPVTGDYYRIVSRESDLAITDMAKQETTDNGQYITGSQLQLMPIDETDNRQLWRFMPAGDNWAIENKATHLAWNNSHGDSADGNPVISWTNNSDNATKTTRQWYLQQSDETISSVIAAQQDNNPNYRILYDPHTNQLRLQMDNGQSSVVNDIAIYDLNGRKIDTQCTMFNIQSKNSPSIYLLRWTINGHTYSRKIRLSKP